MGVSELAKAYSQDGNESLSAKNDSGAGVTSELWENGIWCFGNSSLYGDESALSRLVEGEEVRPGGHGTWSELRVESEGNFKFLYGEFCLVLEEQGECEIEEPFVQIPAGL